jgi:hypothetical protein
MQDWPQAGAGRAANTEAERDPAATVPDRPEPAAAQEDSAEWDELTHAAAGQVSPPADVLVAGAPLRGSTPLGEPALPAETPTETPAEVPAAPTAEPAHGGGRTIIESGAADGFHERWRDVQFGFVDDPQAAVRQADELADEVVRSFTDAIEAHKRALADRWRSQRDAAQDTERLRLLVRSYREFVDRLLTT